jgi:hypothetical protein
MVAGFRRWPDSWMWQGVVREGRRVLWSCPHTHTQAKGWSAYGTFSIRIHTATECAEERLKEGRPFE